jgi:hypothetical protein
MPQFHASIRIIELTKYGAFCLSFLLHCFRYQKSFFLSPHRGNGRRDMVPIGVDCIDNDDDRLKQWSLTI